MKVEQRKTAHEKLIALRDSQGLPEDGRIEVDFRALLDVLGIEIDWRIVPRPPKGARVFAVDLDTGQWFYENHASTWQTMPDPIAHRLAALTPTPAESAGWEFADKLMNWLNALDSSEMQAKDVRSAVYHWVLDFRPQKPVMSPEDRESVQLLEAIKAELFVLNVAVSTFIANIDEYGPEVGEAIADLRAAEKQASDFLMSFPIPTAPGDVE